MAEQRLANRFDVIDDHLKSLLRPWRHLRDTNSYDDRAG